MANIKNIVAAFAVTLLVMYLLITFTINTQIDNGADNQISSDPFINKTFGDITSQIQTQQSSTDTQSSAFETEAPKSDSFSQSSNTIVTGTKSIKGVSVTQTFNLLSVIAQQRLGIPQIVFYVAGIILGVTMLLLMWRAIRWGE